MIVLLSNGSPVVALALF